MCWYSAEHSKVLQAEAGQRIVTRRMHGSTNWLVRESDATTLQPCAVCLLDGTDVVIRPSEDEQARLKLPPEPKAVFRMLTRPKRDVLVFADGREIAIDGLPTGLILDVLGVPGSEKLSSVLETHRSNTATIAQDPADETEAEPVLGRLRRFFMTSSVL